MGVTELFRNPQPGLTAPVPGEHFPNSWSDIWSFSHSAHRRENPAAPEVRPKGSCQLLPGNHSPNWWICSWAKNQAQVNHNRRSVKGDEHVASGRHQMPPGTGVILVILIICAALCTVIIAFTVKVLLHSKGKYYIPREMRLSSHSVSIWKAQRKSCTEDLNYLGRKENIYWIDTNFKNRQQCFSTVPSYYLL